MTAMRRLGVRTRRLVMRKMRGDSGPESKKDKPFRFGKPSSSPACLQWS